MKTAIYAIWSILGFFLFAVLLRTHQPLWLIATVVVWGFLCGTWAYLAGEEKR